ncbi:AraC family transcriptional regulator [Herbaspirillum sp. VT-16-41]|uniref:cupin domain-containing protein n=1 Tax=Herbaspirillum sp. VT-16-41 TaxID=1953765 RepID=UPI000980DED7|nr:AraC family transcriptional regulator [Herbaspirillum sp. VT-16-41]ONN68304.1 AraC family transcriptional regulator [Herbaspirillum sp. VT-16-41]
MDALSRLLSLHPVRAGLDIRCRFGQPWDLPNPALPTGVAPYHFILEGQAQLQLPDSEALTLQAGDLVILTRGAAHHLSIAPATPATQASPVRLGSTAAPVTLHVNDDQGGGSQPLSDFLCGQFHFEAPHSNALMQALPELLLVRSAELPEGDGLRTLATLLRNECGGADGQGELRSGAQAVVAGLAAALFGLALRAWLARGGPQPGLLALLAHPVLQSAMQAMLESPQEDWPLPRLAGLCHMSRATFVRRFQEVGGTTPGEVLQQLRMARAARLLSYSKLGTAQIGEAVGYQSEAAFNRVFKKYSGLGPGAYRRKSRAAEAVGEEGGG